MPQDIVNLEVYINYMILYEGLHGLSKVLNNVVKDNAEFQKKVKTNLKEIPEMNTFIESYKRALKDSTTNIYKETDVNIFPFKEEDEDDTQENTTTIFLIKDFDKVKNIVLLTFYQIYLYIFTYDIEEKEIRLSNEFLDVTNKKTNKSLEILKMQAVEVNTLCSGLFKIRIKELCNKSMSPNMIFRNCLERLKALMMS
eukprot:GAHX01001932.1.p1 GENE.GAHX01001932.1~~GAHX01001932.1.p1  ORF type:complete len:198 (+),score=29.99 GAHX01001932.1:315-908(+)